MDSVCVVGLLFSKSKDACELSVGWITVMGANDCLEPESWRFLLLAPVLIVRFFLDFLFFSSELCSLSPIDSRAEARGEAAPPGCRLLDLVGAPLPVLEEATTSRELPDGVVSFLVDFRTDIYYWTMISSCCFVANWPNSSVVFSFSSFILATYS